MEGFDNYGLRVIISADYQYDDGRRVGQYKQVLFDPGTDDIMEALLQMIEGCYGWGIGRVDLIERIKLLLDDNAKEFKVSVYDIP